MVQRLGKRHMSGRPRQILIDVVAVVVAGALGLRVEGPFEDNAVSPDWRAMH